MESEVRPSHRVQRFATVVIKLVLEFYINRCAHDLQSSVLPKPLQHAPVPDYPLQPVPHAVHWLKYSWVYIMAWRTWRVLLQHVAVLDHPFNLPHAVRDAPGGRGSRES